MIDQKWRMMIDKLVRSLLLKLTLSLALLYLVFRQIDLGQIWLTISQVPVAALGLFALFWTILYVLCAWRWSLLIFQTPDRHQFVSCLKATFIGLFYNLVMPSAIGGDVIKWTALNHYNLSKKHLIFTVFLDRFVGLVGLVMAGVVAVIVSHQLHLFQLPRSAIYGLGLFTSAVAFGWVLLLLANQLLRFNVIKKVKYLHELLLYAGVHKKTLFQAVMISILVQFFANLSVYILAKAVGFHSSLFIFFVIEPIIAVITSLPISFAGLGTTEAVALYFFQSVGELPTAILAFTTLLTIFRFIYGFVGWGVLITQRKNHQT